MKTINILSFGMVLLLVAACGPTGDDAGKSSGAAFQLLSEKQSGIRFKNQLSPTYDNNIIEFDYFYNGGGVALGDVNQDGLTDIFFSGNMVSSALYLNKGDLKFEEITDLAGLQTDRWATGVMMTDINADGWLDIYVCFSGLGEGKDRRNSFFINQGLSAEGVPTFVDRAAEMGLADEGYSTQAAFFDYDKDGDLDLYLLTALHDKFNPNFPKKKENNGQSPSTDRLYRNDGITADGLPKFINVSTEAGITYEGYGLGVAINDVNKDGWEDIYVANDFIFDDLLYINQGNGTFKEEAANYTRHSSRFSMGCDLADINNDALVDIMVLDMLPADNHRQKMMSTATSYQKYKLELRNGYRPQYSRNVLQLNMGKAPDGTHAFSDIGYLAGVYKTDWSWAPLLVDFDNDGYRDLFITNGIPKDITNNDYIAYRDNHINPNADYDELKKDFLGYIDCLPDTYFSNYMYRNFGKDDRHAAFSFEDVTKSWGLSGLTCSNGAAYGDLDNDGDLDLVINNVNDRAFLYESKVSDQGNQWLRVQLHGPANNPSGLGSEITLSARGNTQFYHQSVARGFQSCQEATLQFGLGSAKQADSLEVIWPDGKMQRMVTVPAGQVIHLYYKDATVGTPKYVASKAPIFKNVSLSTGIGWAHRENTFDEFDAEFLLPHQYSKQGPGVAVGDVNGDGLDDFVAAGAMGQATTIFIQDNKGKFQERAFDANANREDIGVLLFDADNDSDLDLYVASGGSEFMAGTPPYQDRLYVNDGKGNFTLDQSALPRMFVSTSCVTAADYDQDGDLDLFVGGRIGTGTYPLPVRSFLLRNDGGKFVDVTIEQAPDLLNAGLVTSVLWTDFDNDADRDLIIAGEWMPLTFFRNDQGQFTNVTSASGVGEQSGWWNSLAGGDFDQDGDIDYIAGNLGLNSSYKASAEEPLRVYANDFDRNGSVDPIITKYVQGTSYPVAGRDKLISQMMIFTRKRFPNYEGYADVTIEDLFSETVLSESYQAKATHFASSYLENLGNGRFKLHPLPLEAQFAPLYGIAIADMDGDQKLDVLLSGNSYASDYMAGRYDAMNGLFLKGDGAGQFQSVLPAESGFWAVNDQKALALLQSAQGSTMVLAMANNNPITTYSYTTAGSTVIPLRPEDSYAEITQKGGKLVRQEFYYGSGYLSASSRQFVVPQDAEKVVIYSANGEPRELSSNLEF